MTIETIHYARQYPTLTIDALTFAIYVDLVANADDHGEFDIYNDNFDDRTSAIIDDLDDLIHNGNHYDYLSYFASPDDLQDVHKEGMLQGKLDVLLGLEKEAGESDSGRSDRYYRVLDEIGEKVSTMMQIGLDTLHMFSGFKK